MKRIDDAIRALAKNGRITPEAVVEAARDKKSMLHDRFEWDDKKAAHENRLAIARELIRGVKVKTTISTMQIRAPEFVRDPALKDERVQGYVSLGKLRSDEDLARDAVVSEFSRAASALARAKAVAAALGLEDEIDDLRQQIEVLSDRVQQPGAQA